MNADFEKITKKLKTHPASLDSMDEWLFVAVNTMKAIVDNSKREDILVVLDVSTAKDTAEVKRFFDMIQGRYAREGFSFRNSPSYNYLCSLVARFDERSLNDENRDSIKSYYEENRYLLYEI